MLHRFLIESEGLRHIIEDADVIHDKAMGLLLAIGAICTTDGLQEIVVLHRLVEIHHLKDRRIKSGQELACDNHELERVSRITKPVEQLFFLVFIASMLLPIRRIAGLADHDDGGRFRTDQLVHHLLIEHATFPVERHNLCLESIRLNLGLEMLHDVIDHRTRSGFFTRTAILAARFASCMMRSA